MIIKVAIRFKNDMVMAFDASWDPIPEYQGQYGEVKEKILRDAPVDAVFAHGFTNSGKLLEVPREEW